MVRSGRGIVERYGFHQAAHLIAEVGTGLRVQIPVGRRARSRGWITALGSDAHDQSDEGADKRLSVGRVHAQQGYGYVLHPEIASTD
jgi:hypothetical protein